MKPKRSGFMRCAETSIFTTGLVSPHCREILEKSLKLAPPQDA